MANINNNFSTYPFQNQNMTQYFLQPQGMVYFINNLNELSNINMNANVIVGICLPEETCYVKTFQNGIQNISSYKLINQNNENRNINDILIELDARIKRLENSNKTGGRLDELI